MSGKTLGEIGWLFLASVIVAGLLLLGLISCGPEPSPSPTPTPLPTPSPLPGWDCTNPPTLRGVVQVKGGLAGKYTVRLRRGLRAASSDRVAARHVLSGDVQGLRMHRNGFAAEMSASAARRVAADPDVQFVHLSVEMRALGVAQPVGAFVLRDVSGAVPGTPAQLLRPLAGLTHHQQAGPVLPLDDARVVNRELVAAGAGVALPLRSSAVVMGGVALGTLELEVGGVNAGADLADVVDLHVIRNRADVQEVRGPMGVDRPFRGESEAAVAMSAEASSPWPTAAEGWRPDVLLEPGQGGVLRQLTAARPSAGATAGVATAHSAGPLDREGGTANSARKRDNHSQIVPQRAVRVWNLDRVDQRSRQLDGDYSPGADGAGVHVAIIDTGADSRHVEFAGRMGECFSAQPGGCEDAEGHGTHVMASAGGATFGVANAATLHAVRVLDANGSGTDGDVIEGIEWVTARKQANPASDWVANMSLGGDPSPALDAAVCDSIEAGVVHVVAAGNDAGDAQDGSPSRVAQAITVAASDRNDAAASFSNRGLLIDLWAPGVQVESARRGGGSTTLSGTSMASPHVAGGAALWLQREPGSAPSAVRANLVQFATRDALSGVGDSLNALLFVRAE